MHAAPCSLRYKTSGHCPRVTIKQNTNRWNDCFASLNCWLEQLIAALWASTARSRHVTSVAKRSTVEHRPHSCRRDTYMLVNSHSDVTSRWPATPVIRLVMFLRCWGRSPSRSLADPAENVLMASPISLTDSVSLTGGSISFDWINRFFKKQLKTFLFHHSV